MNTTNWYTNSLVITAIVSLLFSIAQLEISNLQVFLVILIIIIMLEIFPIQMPSGDQYAAGSIGFLFLLIHDGFYYSVIAIYIAAFAYYLKNLRNNRIPLIRFFVTIGMYIASVFASFVVWKLINHYNLFLAICMTALVFEMINIFLIEAIQATVYKQKMFTKFKQQLVELIIPTIVCIIFLSYLIQIESNKELIISMFYTLFFFLVVIFFSHEFMKQLSLRQSTTKAFIQVMEGRITSSLAGHGNRVGIICDTILDDLGYPKRKRHDLIQAATIHDIGKALLPSYIFRKRGDLTLSEEQVYRTHPEQAVEIVKTMFPKESFSNWILYHHERWDGKGFPKGLQSENIPLESRILALANELDHILSRHNDQETILRLLKEKAGTVLDPKIVNKVELHHIHTMMERIQHLSSPKAVSQPSETLEGAYNYDDTYSSMGESFFIQIRNGHISSSKDVLPIEFIQSVTATAMERQQHIHETYIHNNRTYDVHVQPLQKGDASIFVHDLTPHIHYRNKLEQDILDSYVEVVNILTDGKIILHSSKTTLENQLGVWLDEMPIHNNSDVPKSRELAKNILEQFPTEIKSMKVQLSVTEAVTNILKHATQGKLSIYRKDHTLQFLISDKGSGIPLHEIPKTILVSGYSSKRSLGHGFKMINNFSDGFQIYTSSEGTYMLIEFKQQDKKKEEKSDAS